MLTKTNKTSKLITKRKFLIAFSCVLVLIIIVISLEVFGVTHFVNQPKSKTDVQKIESDTNTQNKQKFIENTSTSTNSGGTNDNLTASDITLSTRRENDGSVTISTQLKNYSDGTCKLTIQNGSSAYTQSASVIYQQLFSSCAGFNIPSNTVSAGLWQISLSVTSKGTTNTQSTTLEVQ